MEPKVWGPAFWSIFHVVAANYPQNPTPHHQSLYQAFMTSFGGVLPCEQCKLHYAKHLDRHPLNAATLASRDTLFDWSWAVHDAVNQALRKMRPSLVDVRRMYKLPAVSAASASSGGPTPAPPSIVRSLAKGTVPAHSQTPIVAPRPKQPPTLNVSTRRSTTNQRTSTMSQPTAAAYTPRPSYGFNVRPRAPAAIMPRSSARPAMGQPRVISAPRTGCSACAARRRM